MNANPYETKAVRMNGASVHPITQEELGSLFVDRFGSMPDRQHAGEISVMSVLVFLPISSAERKRC